MLASTLPLQELEKLLAKQAAAGGKESSSVADPSTASGDATEEGSRSGKRSPSTNGEGAAAGGNGTVMTRLKALLAGDGKSGHNH